MDAAGRPDLEPRPVRSLFIVEDDLRAREGLVDVLSAELDVDVVGWAGSIAAAQIAAPPLSPAVMLIDYRLPDGTGADLIHALRAELPLTAYIVHSGLLDDAVAERCLAAGAFACLPKQVRLAPLLHAIRTAHSPAS